MRSPIPRLLLLCLGLSLLCLVILQILVPDSRGYSLVIFYQFLAQQDVPAAWVCLASTVATILISRFTNLESWPRFVSRNIISLCLLAFIFYSLLSVVVVKAHPLSMDEYSVVFQSKLLASGHVAATIPTDLIDFVVPSPFQGHFLHVSWVREEITPSYWPGYAFLVVPFSLLGVPFLANCFYTAFSVFVVHRAARELTRNSENSELIAGYAALFMFVSPTISMNAATNYSMPAHLLFNAVFVLLIAKGTRRTAFLAGLCGSYALTLHNPVPHFIFCLPWLWWMARNERRNLVPLLVGYCVIAPFIGLKWVLFLGTFDASRYAIQAIAQGESKGPLLDIIARIMVSASPPTMDIWFSRILGISKMALWSSPSLLVFAFCKSSDSSNSKQVSKVPPLSLLLVSTILMFCAYLIIKFDQGHGWGFRYLQPAWFAFPILAGAFLVGAESRIKNFAIVGAIFSLFILTPYRAFQIENFTRHQLSQIPDVPENAILFINTRHGYYTADLVQNEPTLAFGAWRLRSVTQKENAQIARKYLPAARLEKRGEWGELWIGKAKPALAFARN